MVDIIVKDNHTMMFYVWFGRVAIVIGRSVRLWCS